MEPHTRPEPKPHRFGRIFWTVCAALYFGTAAATGLVIVVLYALTGDLPGFLEGLL